MLPSGSYVLFLKHKCWILRRCSWPYSWFVIQIYCSENLPFGTPKLKVASLCLCGISLSISEFWFCWNTNYKMEICLTGIRRHLTYAAVNFGNKNYIAWPNPSLWFLSALDIWLSVVLLWCLKWQIEWNMMLNYLHLDSPMSSLKQKCHVKETRKLLDGLLVSRAL